MANQTLTLKDLVGNHKSFLPIFQQTIGIPEFISMEMSVPAVSKAVLDRTWNIGQYVRYKICYYRVQLPYFYSNAELLGKS